MQSDALPLCYTAIHRCKHMQVTLCDQIIGKITCNIMQPELQIVRLGCTNTALRGEKKKKGIKSKSQQLVHEDILIDAKNAYIVYLHLVVFSESCFSDFSVFFDLQTGKIFEIFFLHFQTQIIITIILRCKITFFIFVTLDLNYMHTQDKESVEKKVLVIPPRIFWRVRYSIWKNHFQW